MTILQYPEFGYFHILTGPSAELGIYNLAVNGDLALAHLRVLHINANPFDYQMRLVVAQRTGGPALVASNWETFSTATTGQTTDSWMGDLTFTFPDYAIKSLDDYYIRIETTGYARSGDAVYLGVWADWGFGDDTIVPVGASGSGGARIALGVKQ